MKKWCLFIVLNFFISPFFSQDDICEEDVPSSVKKLYEKGKNYKKYDYKHRIKYFKDALEIEEECLACIWELGKMSFRRRYTSGEPMDFPKKYFLQLERFCPSYHADVFYYLSLIYYMEKNDCEAANYFEKFLLFPDDNLKKIAVNYKDQKQYVKASLEMSTYFCDFYNNPVPFNPYVLKDVCKADRNEVLPVISPDNELLYFTSEFDEHIKGDVMTHHEQIFSLSDREDIKDDFKKGISMPPPFNMGPKYGGASLSINNKEMYVCACLPNGAYFNCDIYHTTLKIMDRSVKYDTIDFQWTPLRNLGPNINGPQTWEGQPSLSGDGKTLYFASSRPGAVGKIDIYYSEKNEDGSWGKAKNIGRPINTEESDKSPFIHTDSKTLYFVSESSDLRWGAGDFDIFYTKQNEETGKWDKPTNIGYPINSEGPEESLIVSLDGHYGYFSSQRKEGIGGKDIFNFEIPVDAKPEKVVLIKGVDQGGDPDKESNTKLFTKDENGERVEQSLSFDEEGSFVALVNVEDAKGDIALEFESEGAGYQSILLTQDEIQKSVVKEKEVEIKQVEPGTTFTINDILFEINSSNLLSSSTLVLDGFVDWLIKNESLKVEIQGHTDDVGRDEDNMALSMDRAFSVMEYILSKGVEKNRLTFKGYGETNPKVPNDTDINRSKNRRTDFLIF